MAVMRLIKRSMTSAKARIELATSGQIGQPAACMIENKLDLRADEMPRDYHAGLFRGDEGGRRRLSRVGRRPTKYVDNFVKK